MSLLGFGQIGRDGLWTVRCFVYAVVMTSIMRRVNTSPRCYANEKGLVAIQKKKKKNHADSLQGGAPKIAKLVYKSNFTRTYGRYIYS